MSQAEVDRYPARRCQTELFNEDRINGPNPDSGAGARNDYDIFVLWNPGSTYTESSSWGSERAWPRYDFGQVGSHTQGQPGVWQGQSRNPVPCSADALGSLLVQDFIAKAACTHAANTNTPDHRIMRGWKRAWSPGDVLTTRWHVHRVVLCSDWPMSRKIVRKQRQG